MVLKLTDNRVTLRANSTRDGRVRLLIEYPSEAGYEFAVRRALRDLIHPHGLIAPDERGNIAEDTHAAA